MVERLGPGLVVDGRFTLVAPLGEGGFGEVWRARDRSLERDVALKFMRPELLRNDSLRRRFEREAAALAAVTHPNVVQVIDKGEWQGRPFVIMEFVQGVTLRAWLERHRGAAPTREVRSLFAQICEGVGAAHDGGIVHRDLKPENVLLAEGARRTVVKVLDFGLARIGGGQSSVMMTVGTYEYMSPEQASEGSEELDARSDVFALGVMLLEMLTGQRLPGDGKKSWERVVDNGRGAEFVGRMAALRTDVPAAVWAEAKQALARAPHDRFKDAEALNAALDAAWSGVPDDRASTAPAPAPAARRTPPPVPRVPEPAPLASVAMMPSMATPRAPAPAPVAVERRPSPAAAARTEPMPVAAPVWPKVAVGVVALLGLAGGGYALLGRDGSPATTPATVVTDPAAAVVTDPAAAVVTDPAAVGAAPVVALPAPTHAPGRCDDGMVRVAGGAVARAGSALPPATVAAFCLDRTEVTVAAIRRCVSAGRCAAPTPAVNFNGVTAAMHRRYDPYCTLNPRFADSANTPVNCVGWEVARAYCEQRGARLPTEAEWELAARGPEGRTYPWGDAPAEASRLNACGEGECPSGQMFAGQDGYAAPAPVGSFAAGNTAREGLQDMAGNVAEWVSDAFMPTDGAGASGPMHGVRGGGWSTVDAAAVRGANRDGVPDGEQRPEVGFRCASAAR